MNINTENFFNLNLLGRSDRARKLMYGQVVYSGKNADANSSTQNAEVSVSVSDESRALLRRLEEEHKRNTAQQQVEAQKSDAPDTVSGNEGSPEDVNTEVDIRVITFMGCRGFIGDRTNLSLSEEQFKDEGVLYFDSAVSTSKEAYQLYVSAWQHVDGSNRREAGKIQLNLDGLASEYAAMHSEISSQYTGEELQKQLIALDKYYNDAVIAIQEDVAFNLQAVAEYHGEEGVKSAIEQIFGKSAGQQINDVIESNNFYAGNSEDFMDAMDDILKIIRDYIADITDQAKKSIIEDGTDAGTEDMPSKIPA